MMFPHILRAIKMMDGLGVTCTGRFTFAELIFVHSLLLLHSTRPRLHWLFVGIPRGPHSITVAMGDTLTATLHYRRLGSTWRIPRIYVGASCSTLSFLLEAIRTINQSFHMYCMYSHFDWDGISFPFCLFIV
jgi:hypothetical protein